MKDGFNDIDPFPWKTNALNEMGFAARCVLLKFYGITDVARGNECEKLRQCVTVKMGWIVDAPDQETRKSDLTLRTNSASPAPPSPRPGTRLPPRWALRRPP